MLPAYLSMFVVGEDGRGGMSASLRRAASATVAMTSGFVVVFATFGLLFAPVAGQLQRWLPSLTVIIGLVLATLGVLILAGRSVAVRVPFLRLTADPVASPRSMFAYGVAYAIASLGCTIAPFLVVTASTFTTGDPLTGILGYAAYGVGMGLLVGVLAVAAALGSRTLAGRLRAATPYIVRAGGALLVLVGAYVSWYGWYELRLYNGGVKPDPVVEAAGRVQSHLASWVEVAGWGGIALGGLAVLVVAGLGARVRRRPRAPLPVGKSDRSPTRGG